jgi:hypothetical protein
LLRTKNYYDLLDSVHFFERFAQKIELFPRVSLLEFRNSGKSEPFRYYGSVESVLHTVFAWTLVRRG